jgi:hypothetical protein
MLRCCTPMFSFSGARDRCATPALARTATADVGPVMLDVTLEHFEALGLGHEVADLLARAPRGLVGDAERAL